MLALLAATTWTLTPRFFAATSAFAMSQSSKDHVAIRMVPLPGNGVPRELRRPPHTLWMVASTRLRIAIRSALLLLGKLKYVDAGIT